MGPPPSMRRCAGERDTSTVVTSSQAFNPCISLHSLGAHHLTLPRAHDINPASLGPNALLFLNPPLFFEPFICDSAQSYPYNVAIRIVDGPRGEFDPSAVCPLSP